jgi:hypothetical protein
VDGVVPRGRLLEEAQGGVAAVRREERAAAAAERVAAEGGSDARDHGHCGAQICGQQQFLRLESVRARVGPRHHHSVPERRAHRLGVDSLRAPAPLSDHPLLQTVPVQGLAPRQRKLDQVAVRPLGGEGEDAGDVLPDGRVPGGQRTRPASRTRLLAFRHLAPLLHHLDVHPRADFPSSLPLLQLSDLLALRPRIPDLSGEALPVTGRTDASQPPIKTYEQIVRSRSNSIAQRRL